MKKTLLSLALVIAAGAAFAQGKVGFQNDSTRVFTLGTTLQSDAAFAGQGIPVAGLPSGGLSALLYAGTSAGSLTLQTAIPLTGSSIIAPGRMANKQVLLSIPGATVQQFQIVIVSTEAPTVNTIVGGADRDAFAGSSYFGTSGLFTFTPGTSVTYPVIYGAGSTWASGPVVVNAVPEPSSMALAGLGAASLLIFRRRK
jgi:hypothetical protein